MPAWHMKLLHVKNTGLNISKEATTSSDAVYASLKFRAGTKDLNLITYDLTESNISALFFICSE